MDPVPRMAAMPLLLPNKDRHVPNRSEKILISSIPKTVLTKDKSLDLIFRKDIPLPKKNTVVNFTLGLSIFKSSWASIFPCSSK